MAFADYKNIDAVVKKFRMTYVQGPVLPPVPDPPAFNDYFRGEIDFNLRNLPIGRSEGAAGEILLFPILREVWKPYVAHLALFSHEELEFDADLRGVPDYFVCRVSEYGQTIPEVPYLLVAEAKLDDFEKAWGQCAAAMLAAQKLNQSPDVPVYGMATNGQAWQFGMLRHQTFTVQPGGATVTDLDALAGQMHAVFRTCRDLAVNHPTPSHP